MNLEVDNNKFAYSRHGMIRQEHDNGIQKWTCYIPKCGNVGILYKGEMLDAVVAVVIVYKKRTWLIPLSNPSKKTVAAVRNLFSGYCLHDQWLAS